MGLVAKLYLLGLVIAIGGAASLAFGYVQHQRDAMLGRWPAVTGRIVSSQIVRTTQARLRTPARDALPPSKPEYQMAAVWALDVEYHYTVNGRDHTGYRATSNLVVQDIRREGDGPGERLRALAARLPAGASVPVHYDPADPRESYLLHVDSPGKAPLVRTGVALLAVAAAIVVGARLVLRR